MLFANAPINVATAISRSTFQIDTGVVSSVVFSYGSSRFVLALNADGSNHPGIAESVDDGATWAVKNQSYAGLAIASPFGITGSVIGGTIYLAILHGSGGRTIRVLTFDMLGGVYTSTSPDLTDTSSFQGVGIANSIGDYYHFSRQFDLTLGSRVPMMYILSGGSWGTGVRLNTHDAFFATGNACACIDSNDDIHLYWDDVSVGVSEDLVYAKISGSSPSPSVVVKSGHVIVRSAICFGGKQYVSWSKSFSEQWVIVGDSDTNPVSWSDTQIDITNVGGSIQAANASFVADGATLNLFYSAIANGATPHVQQIWYSQLVSGVWSAPISAFDASVNPPSARTFATQFIGGIDVCRTGTAAYACAMNAINATGGTNAYFMSAGATGPTFAARYRVR